MFFRHSRAGGANPIINAMTLAGVISGSSSYIATHHVSPFASVAGASNDYADLGAASWAAAVNSGTPTTLGTAMARAAWYVTGADKVKVTAGVYIGIEPATTWASAFTPANSGTLADPIVFFTENPAAYNYGSTSLYSEIRRTDASPVHAALGSDNTDYVIFDGFYANEALTDSAPAKGIFLAHDSTGTEFRRCAFDRGNSYVAGYNANAIFIQDTIDAVVSDCYFEGRCTYAGNSRQAANIEVYNSDGYSLIHNEHSDYLAGQHIKENDFGSPYITQGSQTYNKFYNGVIAIIAQQGIDNEIAYNLVYDTDTTDRLFEVSTGPDRAGDVLVNFHHNTLVASGAASFFYISSTSALANCVFEDNICYALSGHSGEIVTVINNGAAVWSWTDWTLNNNDYYTVDGTLDFTDTDFSAVSGIVNWRTATSDEANTITSDPEFTSIGTDDYTLADNAQAALTASSTSGPVGCYVTGNEEIGLRTSPTY